MEVPTACYGFLSLKNLMECLSLFDTFTSSTPIVQAKWSPLHTLALSGQIPFMDRLIENGLNIDTVDQVRFIHILVQHLFLNPKMIYNLQNRMASQLFIRQL